MSDFSSTLRALVTAVVVLTGGIILGGGAAAADPNQDDQFLALLDKKEIPALDGVPDLIALAHRICSKLDGGMPVDAVVGDMRKNAFTDPGGQQYAPRRIATTINRFIAAAVEAYCPGDQSKIASIMADRAPGSNAPMDSVAAYTPAAWQEPSGSPVVRLRFAPLIGAVPSGEMTPDPPQIPAPPPPAQILTPPKAIAAPPAPKQSLPAPQQSPPPAPQAGPPAPEAGPPAVAPEPGPAAVAPEPGPPAVAPEPRPPAVAPEPRPPAIAPEPSTTPPPPPGPPGRVRIAP
jgi:Protein of unknown function (DUF732)